jgi:outer membrane protein assembly factor BamD (BamD/ComL family)
MPSEELMAEHELKVARFYLEIRESAMAAKMRSLIVVRKHPRFSEYRDRAIERLRYLGREAPEPDAEFKA